MFTHKLTDVTRFMIHCIDALWELCQYNSGQRKSECKWHKSTFHDCSFYKVLLNVLACLISPALDSSNDPKCVDRDVLLEHNQLLDEVFLGALLAKTFRNNTDWSTTAHQCTMRKPECASIRQYPRSDLEVFIICHWQYFKRPICWIF